jgi:hypothetical protein
MFKFCYSDRKGQFFLPDKRLPLRAYFTDVAGSYIEKIQQRSEVWLNKDAFAGRIIILKHALKSKMQQNRCL